jgi:hypothetical protein
VTKEENKKDILKKSMTRKEEAKKEIEVEH